MKLSGKAKLFRGLTQTFAALLAILVVVGSIAGEWASYINDALGTKSYELVSASDGSQDTIYFKSDYSTPEALIEAREELIRRTAAEGTVVLKNENNALPLNSGAKITLLGIGSYHSDFSATSGGASFSANLATRLPEAINAVGLVANPVVSAFYEEIGSIQVETGVNRRGEVTYGSLYGNSQKKVGEVPVSEFTDEVKNSYSSYNDAAIVVFSRRVGEGSDFNTNPVSTENGGDGVHSLLQLSQSERDVIAEAKENFSKVIVYINTDNMMEIDELRNDPQISAIIWTGGVGNVGMLGVADVISGRVAASGRLADTIVVSNGSSAAAQNYGSFTFQSDQLEGNAYTHYVVYAEGIYVGYKYYETRYEDAVLGQGNATNSKGSTNGGAWNYANEVSYSFGYGLSYTTFQKTLDSVDVDLSNYSAEVKVTVKNTGSVASAYPVQVYVQSPYTDYDKANKVEKAAVSLAGYNKTKILQPGESEQVTVPINMRYVFSYDYTNAKTYILDDGTYYFAVGDGAHDALNNILAAKGKTTSDGMDYNGVAGLAKTWSNSTFRTFSESETGFTVTNQFDDANLNYWMPGTVTYLTRSDWNTFPKKYTDITPTADMITRIKTDRGTDSSYTQDTTKTLDDMITNSGTNYTLMMLWDVRTDYDNAFWDELLNQMSLDDYAMVTYTLYPAIESVSVPASPNTDSPNGLNAGFNTTDNTSPYYVNPDTASDFMKSYKFNTYPTAATRAASFNTKLAEEIGHIMGNDGLWADKCGQTGPGNNTHRTAFGGRNNEYYSEDAVLGAVHGGHEVIKMTEMGLAAAPKHFAFNDQETNRQGLACFFNEQAGREIYLRNFQGSYVDGKPLYGMSSFSRIGLEPATSSVALLTTLLRDEWGWKGFTMTDMANAYMPVVASIVAGTDQWCAFSGNNFIPYTNEEAFKENPEFAWACREAAHRIMYMALNSNAVNGLASDTRVVSVTPWWQTAITGVSIAAGLLTALSFVMYIVSLIQDKKKQKG